MSEIRTNISEIYDNFLSKISDYSLLNLTKEDVQEDLYGYFVSAIANFPECRQDLSVEKVDADLLFNVKLTRYEVEIITKLMLVEYISPTLISSETMKQGLSDKGFKIYSQANQLRELRLLKKDIKSEANKMITKYTFLDLRGEEK